MSSIVSIAGLRKVYGSGFEALSGVDLDIEEGEVLALLGPNGAGKTTLISTICGITTHTGGTVTVGGHDIVSGYRKTRSLIGLVPQDIALEPFAKVMETVRFSRGLFGAPPNDPYIRELLKTLSLDAKANEEVRELSGGMKRRVLIAKALAHEPRILFLDEPTAGVDVELRKGMWETVEKLRQQGVTIILTTHYIEEAEAIADRVAVINKGRILLVEEKDKLMARMGQKELRIELAEPLTAVPDGLSREGLSLGEGGTVLTYSYDSAGERTGMGSLMADLQKAGLSIRDLKTTQSSLEQIFVELVHEGEAAE
ncbi:MAG: ABC transporter ATP-binding protein [Pseudomonadota bacterium]